MIRRQDEMDGILKGLSLLQVYIKFSSNQLGLHNINKACEPFFCELLNIAWTMDYNRLESEKKDYPGIDLGDKSAGSSVQITSNGSNSKLSYTIKMFEKYELYKEYHTLIHFVIGEKHYNEKSRSPFIFNRGEHSIYYYDRVVDGSHEYQIQIWDLMDLIRFIDRMKDSQKVTEIYDYIHNNVYHQVEKFKKKLYQTEPDEIKDFTAESFINKHFDLDYDDPEELYEDIHKLAEVINHLDDDARRVLFKILDVNSRQRRAHTEIFVPMNMVRNELRIPEEDYYKQLKLLIEYELLDEDDISEQEMLNVSFLDRNSTNLLLETYNYCVENGLSFKELLLTPDFSLLD